MIDLQKKGINKTGKKIQTIRRGQLFALFVRYHLYLVVFLMAFSANAKLWLGVDAGINSTAGFISAITFIQERMYTLIHLDIENSGAGYAGLAYRIPAHIGFVPIGFDLIFGGQQNDNKTAFGLYTGFQRELTKNTMFYADVSFSPIKFSHRNVQYFNVDVGLSIALFSILGDGFKSGYTTEKE
jgi:hypothetical protein